MTDYVDKIRDAEYDKESEHVIHSGFRTDNESINESKMSTFSGPTSIR